MTTLMIPPEAESAARGEALEAEQAYHMLQTIPIETTEQIALVSPLLQEIKGNQKRLKTKKELITKPLNAALKEIRDLFRPAEERLEYCERLLKDRIGAAQLAIHQANQAAMAATQVALRQGDVRLAAQASGAIQGTEAPTGLSFRERFTFRVVDASLLPREFLMVDERRIREYVGKHGLASQIPGVVVEADVQVVARAT